METEDKYKLEIQIESDDDFSYDGKDNVIYITNTFEIGYEKLKEHIKEIIDTISGRRYVIEEVKNSLEECLNAVSKNETFDECDTGWFVNMADETVNLNFDFGNQGIYIEIDKATVTNENGIMRIE